jgi:ribosome-associated translation inhibitor RaiA/cold shock CspA family protein
MANDALRAKRLKQPEEQSVDIPLEIAFHNTEHSDRVEERVRRQVDRMHRRFNHINSCRVVVEVPHRSQSGPREYHVRVEVRVPDKELVVSKDPGDRSAHDDPLLAVRDSFQTMERMLEQHSQLVRGEVKHHDPPLQGRVRKLFSDHGFVATNDGREIYFHRNAVVDVDFDTLSVDDPVQLVLIHGESPMGPQATSVKPIGQMEYVDEPPSQQP